MKMNRITSAVFAFVFGFVFAVSCGKEAVPDEPDQDPKVVDVTPAESVIYLMTEEYGDGETKVSVQDETVIWETGDVIGLNDRGRFSVTVSDGKAYISDPQFSTVCALYPCPSENNFFISSRPTITVPATYNSSNNYMVGTRQHIPLPMGSYYNSSGNPTSLTFRHVSAAVKVMLWNDTTYDLIVDKVVVKTNTYRINGSVTLDLTDDNLGMAASYVSSSADDRAVYVEFPLSGEGSLILTAGDNTKSVQVPILPIGADNLTIEVYAHVDSHKGHTFIYEYTQTSAALSRNQMLTARCRIRSGAGYHATESIMPDDLEVVDLGLTVKWANLNIGANHVTDFGDYFAWGEVSTKPTSDYTWSGYKYCNGAESTLTKYCGDSSKGYNGYTDALTTLLPEDDAAAVNWGGEWRMPTGSEFAELKSGCNRSWQTNYNGSGVKGFLFTSKTNGNSIFFPAAGYYFPSLANNSAYWSSSLSTKFSVNYAVQMNFMSDGSYPEIPGDDYRFKGCPIRPVCE